MEAGSHTHPPSPEAAKTTPEPSSRKAVLLVDDEIAYLDLLEQLLSEHIACPVIGFTRPFEALRALPSLDVGLIVTDYYMPGLNGCEFIVEVGKVAPHIPVIMITAHDVHFTESELALVPALKVIVQKPFRWTYLSEQILKYWPEPLKPRVSQSSPP
ncbi:MAG: response regulator [Opitutaceae bacterium]|nr:response regulator [Opitutaceae bacterium]